MWIWLLSPALQPALHLATHPAHHVAQPAGRVEPFPGVVVDYDARAVELAGFVPVDVHQPETPEVWIELIAEAGGLRDHEALVRLDAPARHVHAALLLLGLKPGRPGLLLNDGGRREPTGPRLTVAVLVQREDGITAEDPTSWVHLPETGERLSDRGPTFVFAGSGEREFQGQTVYMAEAEGVVVGLCTFGAGDPEQGVGIETVGMSPVLSPDAGSGDPVWLADPGRVPPFGARVTLVLSAVREASAPAPSPRASP
jgi:hypothetical protein